MSRINFSSLPLLVSLFSFSLYPHWETIIAESHKIHWNGDWWTHCWHINWYGILDSHHYFLPITSGTHRNHRTIYPPPHMKTNFCILNCFIFFCDQSLFVSMMIDIFMIRVLRGSRGSAVCVCWVLWDHKCSGGGNADGGWVDCANAREWIRRTKQGI